MLKLWKINRWDAQAHHAREVVREAVKLVANTNVPRAQEDALTHVKKGALHIAIASVSAVAEDIVKPLAHLFQNNKPNLGWRVQFRIHFNPFRLKRTNKYNNAKRT